MSKLYFKCEKHKNTFMVLQETVVLVLTALITEPNIEVYKLEKCDSGGWHIFTRIQIK